MTKLSTKELVCPECGSEKEFIIYDSVNVALDPDAKDKLINGELTVFTCDECGYRVEVVYPMLYYDMNHKLMIWMDPEANLIQMDLKKAIFFLECWTVLIGTVLFRPEKRWSRKYMSLMLI